MIPADKAAELLGMSADDLWQLCADGNVPGAQIVDHEWFTPNNPCVVTIEDRLGMRGPIPDDMLPLATVARRDGISVSALQRLCRMGKVNGARKEMGTWFIPLTAPRVHKPRRGRVSLGRLYEAQMAYEKYLEANLPDWLK